MQEVICTTCNSCFNADAASCPGCNQVPVLSGSNKNVIDQLTPNCLIHRYDGSDLLEPATIIKTGRTNYKVALKLADYNKPITVAKTKAYHYDPKVLTAIQMLRQERTNTMNDFDQKIGSYWNQLHPFDN